MNLVMHSLIFVLPALLAPMLYVMLTGDYPGHMLMFGLEEDSPIVSACLEVRAILDTLGM